MTGSTYPSRRWTPVRSLILRREDDQFRKCCCRSYRIALLRQLVVQCLETNFIRHHILQGYKFNRIDVTILKQFYQLSNISEDERLNNFLTFRHFPAIAAKEITLWKDLLAAATEVLLCLPATPSEGVRH